MTNALNVKRAIVTAIRQQPEFQNRQVEFGHPGSRIEHESVFVVSVSDDETARSLGKAHRRETLTVELGILSDVVGSDQVEAQERAYVMLAGVENAIAQDSSLGGLALMSEITGFSETSFSGDQRSVSEITVQVRVVANKDFDGS
jgi:hypothetical protein